MNELQVKVQQTPGTVTWNYEDLKKAITNALEVYKTTEYDDSNIGQAKKDRAMLNKRQEELAKREAELAAQNQQEEATQTSGYPERPQSDIGRTIDNIEREAFARATASTPIQEPIVELAPEPVQDPEIPFDPKPSQTIRITGSPEDYQKVIEYIKAMGIDYEEV